MSLFMEVQDVLHPTIDNRVKTFGFKEGMIVADYGCGPGRYALRFSKIVGDQGRVYAVDIQPLAIEAVRKKIEKYGLKNITPVLAQGYQSGLPDSVADRVSAVDMFHSVMEPKVFLKELRRITKADGLLIIDDGHQSRAEAKEKILSSKSWKIVEETTDHLKCQPV
jgi:ubiquinone/menaquinone biosynthesis C-methylase UbiE